MRRGGACGTAQTRDLRRSCRRRSVVADGRDCARARRGRRRRPRRGADIRGRQLRLRRRRVDALSRRASRPGAPEALRARRATGCARLDRVSGLGRGPGVRVITCPARRGCGSPLRRGDPRAASSLDSGGREVVIRPAELIQRKRDGEELSDDELAELILGYARGEIPDYQLAAFAMAVYFRGLSPRETYALTDAMVQSGETIDLHAEVGRLVADKHSTGGVGDKASLVVAPLVAACGVPFGKMSGRGLGHTGGTLDKLESIPGFRVELTDEE